jgi:hypothetical protein
MPNTSYVSQEDQTQVNLSTKGTTKIAETITPLAQSLIRPKRKLDIKMVPNQTDDTPKTKKRYFYEKTGNYVSYARAKQLGLVK